MSSQSPSPSSAADNDTLVSPEGKPVLDMPTLRQEAVSDVGARTLLCVLSTLQAVGGGKITRLSEASPGTPVGQGLPSATATERTFLYVIKNLSTVEGMVAGNDSGRLQLLTAQRVFANSDLWRTFTDRYDTSRLSAEFGVDVGTPVVALITGYDQGYLRNVATFSYPSGGAWGGTTH